MLSETALLAFGRGVMPETFTELGHNELRLCALQLTSHHMPPNRSGTAREHAAHICKPWYAPARKIYLVKRGVLYSCVGLVVKLAAFLAANPGSIPVCSFEKASDVYACPSFSCPLRLDDFLDDFEREWWCYRVEASLKTDAREPPKKSRVYLLNRFAIIFFLGQTGQL